MPRPLPLIAGLHAAAVLGLCACGTPRRSAAPEAPPLAVHVAKVAAEAGPGSAWAPGIVAARDRATIVSRVAATVEAIPVREGQTVAAGQLLALLDQRDAAARLRAAEAGRDAALAEKDRVDRLAARESATKQEQERAAASAEAARAAAEEAGAALSYLRLTSPFRGRVASVPANAGDLVVPGQKLVEIEADRGYEVQATLEARAAGQLAPGRPVEVRVDGIPGLVPSVVRSISPTGDPETHRFLLRADLEPNPRLRAGIFARVRTPAEAAEPHFVIPVSSAFERGGLTGVFVIEKERAWLRWIAPGEARDGFLVVRAGLAEGELLAADPKGLDDGRRVTIEP